MPAASARGMAPILGLLATTCTIDALSFRARIRSIRFCRVVPPPETQTARRIGGWSIGGSRGTSVMGVGLEAGGSAGRSRDPGISTYANPDPAGRFYPREAHLQAARRSTLAV